MTSTPDDSVEIQARQLAEMGCCYLETEKYEMALSFFLKALQVDPNNKLAKGKTILCQQKIAILGSNNHTPPSSPEISSNEANKTSEKKTLDNSQHISEVERVRWAKTYYDVMGIDSNSIDDTNQLTRKYRNLARILHPDKNRAPGSEAAFKLLHEAYGVLNDPEKKKGL